MFKQKVFIKSTIGRIYKLLQYPSIHLDKIPKKINFVFFSLLRRDIKKIDMEDISDHKYKHYYIPIVITIDIKLFIQPLKYIQFCNFPGITWEGGGGAVYRCALYVFPIIFVNSCKILVQYLNWYCCYIILNLDNVALSITDH